MVFIYFRLMVTTEKTRKNSWTSFASPSPEVFHLARCRFSWTSWTTKKNSRTSPPPTCAAWSYPSWMVRKPSVLEQKPRNLCECLPQCCWERISAKRGPSRCWRWPRRSPNRRRRWASDTVRSCSTDCASTRWRRSWIWIRLAGCPRPLEMPWVLRRNYQAEVVTHALTNALSSRHSKV